MEFNIFYEKSYNTKDLYLPSKNIYGILSLRIGREDELVEFT